MKQNSYFDEIHKNMNLSINDREQIKDAHTMFSKIGLQVHDRLTEEEKNRLPKIEFGVLPTFEANAWAMPIPSGIAICIDLLLPNILAFVSRFVIEAMRNAKLEKSEKSDDLFVTTFRPIWLASRLFETRDIKYDSELRKIIRGLDSLPDDWTHLWVNLYESQIYFIVMHEIQHVLCGHLDDLKKANYGPKNLEEDQIPIQLYQRNINQEFEADRKAVEIFIRDKSYLKSGLISAVDIFFLFLDNLQRQGNKIPIEITHPSASKRLVEVRQKYDELTGGIQGIGKGIRIAIDNLFFLQLEMFNDPGLSEIIWSKPEVWENAKKKYIYAVLEEGMPTHVTFRGEMSNEEASRIVALANQWTMSNEEIVHKGTIKSKQPLLPELGMLGGFIGGIAALAAFLTQFFREKKKAIDENKWNEKYLKLLIENEFLKRKIQDCGVFSINEFNEGFETDGNFCVIILKEKDSEKTIKIEISGTSATFLIAIK